MGEHQSTTWTTATVEEIAAQENRSIVIGPFGSALRAEVYSVDGIPVVRGQDIHDGRRLADSGLVYVPENVAARFPACIAREGDIIFPHRGAIGRVGIVDDRKFLLSSSMMKLTCNRQLVHPLFVFYYFRGPGRAELLARASTVGTPGIGQPLKSLRGIPIRFPKLGQQQAITEVLSALDDKITANTELDHVARGLAKSIFARAAHQGYRITIRSASKLITRGVTPKYIESDGLVILNQKCVREQRVSLTPSRRVHELSSRLDKLLQRDDVLVNSTGTGTLGRVARWTHDVRATVDSHITIVRFDPALIDPVCAGFGLLQIEKEVEGLAEGSTGQTELRRDLLAGLEIAVPDKTQQGAIGAELSALDELCLGLQQESDKLAATRDELLPLLMSGSVRVREAEKIVEGVV